MLAKEKTNKKFAKDRPIELLDEHALLADAHGAIIVVACEICIATNAVRNHIRDHQVQMPYSEMQTMDQVLLE